MSESSEHPLHLELYFLDSRVTPPPGYRLSSLVIFPQSPLLILPVVENWQPPVFTPLLITQQIFSVLVAHNNYSQNFKKFSDSHVDLLSQTLWGGGPGISSCETPHVMVIHSQADNLYYLYQIWAPAVIYMPMPPKFTYLGMGFLLSSGSVFPTAFRYHPSVCGTGDISKSISLYSSKQITLFPMFSTSVNVMINHALFFSSQTLRSFAFSLF